MVRLQHGKVAARSGSSMARWQQGQVAAWPGPAWQYGSIDKWHHGQVASWVPDMFYNFCLVKNHKIGKYSTTTKASEK